MGRKNKTKGENEGKKEGEKASGGTSKWMIVAAVVALLAIGGGVYYKFFTAQMSPEMINMEAKLKVHGAELLAFVEANPLPVPSSEDEYPIPEDVPEELKGPMKKSLDWMFSNPIKWGAVDSSLEYGEEVVLAFQYYVRNSGKKKAFMKRRIEVMIKTMAKSYKLMGNSRLSIRDPSTFVSTLHAAQVIGYPKSEWDYESVAIADIVRNSISYGGPCKSWILNGLHEMGLLDDGVLRSIYQASAIQYEVESRWLTLQMQKEDPDEAEMINAFYLITHEVIPFTWMGLHNLEFAKEADISLMSDLMIATIKYLLKHKQDSTDILGELIVCANALGVSEENKEVILAAYRELITYQKASAEAGGAPGTFGYDARMLEQKRVSAAYRHPVYTALWSMVSVAKPKES